MSKALGKTVIAILTTACCIGGVVGCYYGVHKMMEENRPAIPATVASIFPDYVSATPVQDFDKEFIRSCYEVETSDKETGYYYDLVSAKGRSGSLEFAIGVVDGTVTNYLFLDAGDEDGMGVEMAQNEASELFIGYTLDSTEVISGVTMTSEGMAKAIKAALTDAQGR